jgi:carbamoyltransferase
MNILGIHTGHDSSVALVRDGRVVADVAEERFVRTKHYCGLPIRALDYCLNSQKLTMSNIDIVAVPTLHSLGDLNFLLDLKGTKRERPTRRRQALEFMRGIMNKPEVRPPLYMKTFPLSPRTEIVHVEHHLSHAASAYYTSGTRDKQLIVTIDGSGDGVSVAVWRGESGRIQRLQAFPTSGSVGWFYSNVTEALGWWHGDGEGKTMGLAPYGDHSKCEGVLDKFAPEYANGELIEHHDFGRSCYWNETGATQWHFDDSYAIRDLTLKHGRENIAAEAQRVLEERVKSIVFPWMDRERTRNLSAAGGVMLNVKLNQRLWESNRITLHHTYPNAGDSGLAVGAALYAYYEANPSAQIFPIEHLYWGPEYSAKEIEDTLKLRRLEYKRLDDIEAYTAARLAEGNIVGWFQGAMESGPRALGARSILMSANAAENKDIINARVKFREAFRPFCPSLLWERKEDYLEKARDEFFMITSFNCRPSKRSKVPAVVHADQTLRPQTVKQGFNQRFWNLINEFGKLTGEYLLLNTSFNVMGEPIVNNPQEAIRCFYDNGLDVLVLGNFVLEKNDRGSRPQDKSSHREVLLSADNGLS